MPEKAAMTRYEASVKKRLKVSSLIIFIGLPAIMASGVLLLGQRWYLPLSILMLVLIMMPFFMMFEHRKPKAREVVLIVTMSALTVAAQLLGHMVLPMLQIGTALVIASGVSLGPEAGFLVGALARFILNMYAGQGAWTPWQMFCWGLLGFLAGLCFSRTDMEAISVKRDVPAPGEDIYAIPRRVSSVSPAKVLKAAMAPLLTIAFCEIAAYVSYIIIPGSDGSLVGWRMYAFGAAGILISVLLMRKRLPTNAVTLAVFTIVTTFVIYGGIMNIATMTMSMGMPGNRGYGLDALKALFITGIPYDLAHSVSAAVCIFIFGRSIVSKLERIKIKYGIYR